MLFGAAIAAATLYLVFLFWLAARRDQAMAADGALSGSQHWIYGLSLAVYCTSWTFFGGVGTAATAGLEYLPIYLGPILVFTLGFGLVRRILAQSKAQHSTSIADFLSARYGKSAGVAALVTIIATIGSLPYMTLQLQSVGNSLLLIQPDIAANVALDELVLLVAGTMALFAIIFGSRRADHAGQNAGLVLTIAVESVVKLVALFAVAGLALAMLAQSPDALPTGSVFNIQQIDARFAVLTVIAASAALCLPRQFHMAFVEAPQDRTTPAMQWVFPAYLVLTSVVIVPIALAGVALLPAGTSADSIVMALPLANGSNALALLVFIGGFSASAGMIVVASVALSTMITNDLIAPIAFRAQLRGHGDRTRLASQLLTIRRLVIAALLFFAYLFYLGFGSISSLAGLGTLAFAATAQFAPGLVLGVLSRDGNRGGMIAGLVVGFALWLLLLIVPAASGDAPLFAIHPDPLVSGVLISLGANIAAYWIGSIAYRPSLLDAAQAAAFAGSGHSQTPAFATQKRVADIRLLLAQFVGRRRADAAIEAMPLRYRDADPADEALTAMTERLIAGVVGSSSARMLMGSWAEGSPVELAEVMAMFDETSRRLTFSGDLLQIAIENIDQGVALVDGDMKLVAWNNRYQELFDLPDELVFVGTPIADLIRHNMRESHFDEAEIEEQVARRIEHMRAGSEHRTEREQRDGRIMRIIGNPAPGGGYVTSYTDVTADRRAEQALEDKVAERTQQLSEANAALEKATRSKTRFLAAASHDLIQPLNAARLFASALGEEVNDAPDLKRLVKDLDGSIASADRLIRALLDISRLDGGGLEPKIAEVALGDVFDELMREFAVQGREKGLDIRCVPTTAWVATDRALLVSVLRNLLSNAVRYTRKGGVLLGVRRRGADVLICVIDTGPGIAAEDVERMFEEFQRGQAGDEQGLGLGLAIVRRIARLLDIHIETTSRVGQGTQFAVHMPVLRWAQKLRRTHPGVSSSKMSAARVLVVDNDPAALAATSALLGKWGLEVIRAASEPEARTLCAAAPDAAIMDYQLDDGAMGDAVFASLCQQWGKTPPAILLTAQDGEDTLAAAAAMGGHRLLKPSSPAALRALITDAIARSAREQDQPSESSAVG